MRGKLAEWVDAANTYRITPADAGKTAYVLYEYIYAWDHPRGCGENHVLRSGQYLSTGSPPRMRGKPTAVLCMFPRHGITPADAGKTNDFPKFKSDFWDHPRGCGENEQHEKEALVNAGSPPRMRGKPELKHG